MSKHEASEIHSGTSLGDESLYSFCIHCNQPIELFGCDDDDRGVVFSKDWAVTSKVPSTVSPNVFVTRFDKECLPELAN